ncbi:hypothetical protein [Mesorhizobium sp.]|uniref:hypothetical protein n=1 Tax=Mesorhizobium sp. TaxID=1871066 RepID=UPI00257AE0E4|nr:hypothetical protein [Mesorhizobium sp.]
MIRKLKDGKYRLYSRKKDEKTGKRRNLGTFDSREAAEKARTQGAVFQAALRGRAVACQAAASDAWRNLSLRRRRPRVSAPDTLREPGAFTSSLSPEAGSDAHGGSSDVPRSILAKV